MTPSEAFWSTLCSSIGGGILLIIIILTAMAVMLKHLSNLEQRPENFRLRPKREPDEASEPTPTVPARPVDSPLRPVTTLRGAIAGGAVSALSVAKHSNELIKTGFLAAATSGSHIQVQFAFSPNGFTEVSWQAFGGLDYYPRVKCTCDGVLLFSESGHEGTYVTLLEPGQRYRFRFVVSSDHSPNGKPVEDVERYVQVPTKEMLLATIDDAVSHCADRPSAMPEMAPPKRYKSKREEIEDICRGL